MNKKNYSTDIDDVTVGRYKKSHKLFPLYQIDTSCIYGKYGVSKHQFMHDWAYNFRHIENTYLSLQLQPNSNKIDGEISRMILLILAHQFASLKHT